MVSNIGVVPDFSSLYTTNAGPYTATVQVALAGCHQRSSFDYMDECSRRWRAVSRDSHVLLQRLDGGCDLEHGHAGAHRRAGEQLGSASELWDRAGPGRPNPEIHGVGEVYIPQDMNYPALRLDVDRVHAGETGAEPEGRGGQRHHRPEFQFHDCSQLLGGPQNRQRLLPDRPILREWPSAIHNSTDLDRIIPPAAPESRISLHNLWTTRRSKTGQQSFQTPTEVDHYQIQRVTDVYVTPKGEDLARVTSKIRDIIDKSKVPGNVRVNLRGMVQRHGSLVQEFRASAFSSPSCCCI